MKGGPLRRINDRFSRATPTTQQRDHRAKLVPLGAEDGFDPLPDIEITDDDLISAVTTWDTRMPKRVNGLLDATVTNGAGD